MKQNFDASDAFVALLGCLNKKRYGELDFKTENIKEVKNEDGSISITYDVSYWNKKTTRTTYIESEKKGQSN